MGRIPPRRRKAIRIYQPMLRSWIAIMKRPMRDTTPLSESDESQEQPPVQPSMMSKAKALACKAWHMSDDFNWMSPLPYTHRRWIIVSVLVMILALLWPYSPPNSYSPSQPQQPASIPMQADLRNEQGRTTQLAQPQPQQQQAATEPPQPIAQGNWKSYRVQSGQTLAQLFRDNNLAVGEVFAMAQVEGDQKPLSNLKAGQEVKIQRNAQGAVTSLQVTNEQNSTVLFTRQADGSYQRSR
ncbi:OapA family protein [Ewingella americana]|uniref:Opacity-associated protein A domain protein n=1 Tax=Ewingella americana TaxID=41202 RepID=A0A502GIE7_9GAMM|nr:LysM-like peptidoglycan-binding domain-containing protein [Ewingella americana]TPG61634.1 Opacity-associated protein A domain protein [Ewingella americana]